MTRIYAGPADTVSSLPKGLFEQLQELLCDREDAFVLMEIVSGTPGTRQIDCAVFSPGGVDVIEIKDKKNPVTGSASGAWKTDDGGVLNEFSNRKGGRTENPYQQAANTAEAARAWLGGRRGVHAQRLKVYPMVLIPFAAPGCRIDPDNWVNLALGISQLPGALRALNSRHRVWEPVDYQGLPAELGLIPIDLAEITGKTIDRMTGRALQRVQVEATGLRRPIHVDSRGNFALTVRPGTQVTLRLKPATAHAPLERVVDVGHNARLIELGELYLDSVVSAGAMAQSEREFLQIQAQMERVKAEHAQEVQRLMEAARQTQQDAEEAVQHIRRRQEQEARELERLQLQRDADRLHVAELEARLAESDAQLATLSVSRPEDAERIGRLEAERQGQITQIDGLRLAQERQRQRAEEAQARATATAQELARLQEELPAHLNRLRQLEEERDAQAAELQALRSENLQAQQVLAQAVTGQLNEEKADFAQQVEGVRQRLETWKQQAETAQQALDEAQVAWSGELESERRAFQRREAQLQSDLLGALTRLAALGQDQDNRPGEVLARAAAWLNRHPAGPQDLPRSPLARVPLDKLRDGNVSSTVSLPDRPVEQASSDLWRLPADALMTHMSALIDQLHGELTALPLTDRPLRKGQIKRLRDSLDDVADGLDGALDEARNLMLRLAPQGPGTAAGAAPRAPQPTQVTLSGAALLTPDARPWALHGGELRSLDTGEAARLVIPGLQGLIPADLDGLVGLRAGAWFIPIWALPAERQLDAWLPDSWAAALVEDADHFAEMAAQLSAEQFGVVCRTLQLPLLLEWTGRTWPLDLQGPLHQAVLAAYSRTLQERGAQVKEVPVEDTQVHPPLQLTDLESVPNPPGTGAHNGVSVSLDALELDARVVRGLDPRVQQAGLYLHQALALHLIRQAPDSGHDVVLSTPTASGKTMAFLPGVLEGVLERGGHALFLYPLRALSADQLRTLEGVLERMSGNAPSLGRHFGGEDIDLSGGLPHLLVATPDKLNHALDRDWMRAFAAQLRYVVLDEAHTYRGAFGANMSAFLRRLLMLCPEPPTLILSSATLQNTLTFARLLTGREQFRVVGSSSAPRYPRHLYVGQPRAGWGYRPHLGALRGFGKMVRARNGKGLIFAGSRQGSRDIARELRERGDHSDAPTAFPFYSGMRRYAEELVRLRETKDQPLLAASTSTLEAGIDIGDLDMVAVVGFPRSRNSFKQMAGRAGRSGTAHIAFLPGSSPADLYYARPEALVNLLQRESEPVYLNPHNPVLVRDHVVRARYEAERAGLDTGPGLLTTLFPEGLHPEDAEPLRHTFDLPVRAVRAPLLRGDGTEPHVVISVGGDGQPSADQVNVTVPEEGADWLLERLSPEAAYRDWPLEGRAVRNDRFYRVLGWRYGRLQDGPDGYAQAAVIIAVQDVTEHTLTPEEVLTYRVRPDGDRTLPPSQFAPRTLSRKMHLTVMATRLDAPVECGPAVVAAGVGDVSLKIGDPVYGELLAGAQCTRTDLPFRTPALKRDEPAGVELNTSAGEAVAWQVPTLRPWLRQRNVTPSRRVDDPLWTAYTYPHRLLSRMPGTLQPPPPRVQAPSARAHWVRHEDLPELDPDTPIKVLQVNVHEHEHHTEGPCTCGAAVTLRQWWSEQFSDVREQVPALPDDPARTAAHNIDRYTFSTELAHIRMAGGTDGARRALLLAMVKAMPDLMEIDPQEFSVGVTSCPETGTLEAYLWDVVPGGTGISAAVADVMPALLAAAATLLDRARRCTCGGSGCFGCVLPLERIIDLVADKSSDFDRLKSLSESGFTEDLHVQGALHLSGVELVQP